MDVTIYHNPRCSKSRQTLELLKAKGIEPQVVLYLETPPSSSQIRSILDKLQIAPKGLMRTGEDEYKTSGLNNPSLTADEEIELLAQHPRVIERPIVVCGDRAAIGRPPESVLAIL